MHIGPKIEMRVITLGLDGAGKTSILFKLKQNEFVQTIPTIGFNVEELEYKNIKFTVWDVGGLHKIRSLWKRLEKKYFEFTFLALEISKLRNVFQYLNTPAYNFLPISNC